MYLKLELWKGINEKSVFYVLNEVFSLNFFFRIMLIYIIMNFYLIFIVVLFF